MTVNTVTPGLIETDMVATIPPFMLNKFVETSPCTAWDNPKKSAASSASSPKTPPANHRPDLGRQRRTGHVMEGNGKSVNGSRHWMALEGGVDGSHGGGSYTSRFAGIGASIPERRLITAELMASTDDETDIDLERLTGVRERRVAGEGEDSYTLALDAARDALAHADCTAEDLDVLIVASITHYVGGLRMQLEPPLSVSLKEGSAPIAR